MSAPKKGAMASLWVFDPEEEDAEVEALDCALGVQQSDEDKLMITALGRKSARRWERKETIWLELSPDDALALIVQLTEGLRGMELKS